MIFRVALICLVLFGSIYSVLWLATSTPYFDRNRVKGILKFAGIAICATLLTIVAFATVADLDHLF